MLTKALWKRFEIIYGERWLRQFNESQFADKKHMQTNIQLLEQEWSSAISKFSKNAIKRAVDYARDKHKWAPSIAEFVNLCKEAQEYFRFHGDNGFKSFSVSKKTDEEKKKSKEVALKYLKIMRNNLQILQKK